MNMILHAKDASNRGLGGKAKALAALGHTGIPIPDWFVLSPEAFYASLGDTERISFLSTTDPASIIALIRRLTPSCPVQRALARALRGLCAPGESVAVRSSALDEDGAQHSHAGQFESFLFVRPEDVTEKVGAVWRSAFSARILAYRQERGLGPLTHPPAVLIQRMVKAEVSGVAFGADPVSGRRGVAVVAALYDVGTALVSGECDGDTYHVDRSGRIVHRAIADKRDAHLHDPASEHGLQRIAVSAAKANSPALNDEQVCAVADLARKVSRFFGWPQDIEWAIENGRVCLLQSRPITSLSHKKDPDGTLSLWDNSNIAESYSGVTTPLTFSFARRAYEEVYRQFCRIMGVPAAVIAAHPDTFNAMIGLIRGRIYYNLRSWYQVLSMLPGFTLNRRFMEQMMGVTEELPEDLLPRVSSTDRAKRAKDGLRLLLTAAALVGNHFVLPYRVRRFYRRLDSALAPEPVDIEELRADELARRYRDLERRLLTRWDAPIINDFFTMIFFGLLRALTQKWCGAQESALANELLCDDGEMISAQPARRMRELAEIALAHPALLNLLNEGPLESILEAMRLQPDFKDRYERYLALFGERCLGELKLESHTLQDDPLPLLRSVGQLAGQARSGDHLHSSGKSQLRAQAEQKLKKSLAGKPLSRLLLHWVVRHARARVRERENLRFQRTRVFARARRIFIEIGKRFHTLDVLESPRDIFYVEVNEVLGFIAGTTAATNLKGIAALRKAEFTAYADVPEPDDRFETRGIVHHGNSFRRNVGAAGPVDANRRQGIGCSPGIIRGPVRVVTDPSHATLQRGHILVAERTDPGWIMLFAAAAGLLVEHGSLLSHSAVLSREMGIPAVVSLSGATRWLKDGDWIELDGETGAVRRIAASSTEAAHVR